MERGAAPPRVRFSQTGSRGHPGGTVGTTTGRPQGLNPATKSPTGIAESRAQSSPGDGRKIAAAGAR